LPIGDWRFASERSFGQSTIVNLQSAMY